MSLSAWKTGGRIHEKKGIKPRWGQREIQISARPREIEIVMVVPNHLGRYVQVILGERFIRWAERSAEAFSRVDWLGPPAVAKCVGTGFSRALRCCGDGIDPRWGFLQEEDLGERVQGVVVVDSDYMSVWVLHDEVGIERGRRQIHTQTALPRKIELIQIVILTGGVCGITEVQIAVFALIELHDNREDILRIAARRWRVLLRCCWKT
jgi:hypothetical protein